MYEVHVQEMLAELEENLKCPVCLDQLTPPVLQCKNGHNTCSRCKTEDHQQCTLCRQPFVNTTNRVLDKLLGMLSKPCPCPYAADGCPSIESKGHESQWCRFRPFVCPHEGSCGWKGPVMNWVAHSNEKHRNRGFHFINEPMKIKASDSYRLLYSGFTVQVQDNYYFFYEVRPSSNYDKDVKLMIKYVPVKKSDKEYFFKIVFEDHKDAVRDSFYLKPPICFDSEEINALSICVTFPKHYLTTDSDNNTVSITAMPFTAD